MLFPHAVCVLAGVLPSDGSQRDGRADVHSASDVQTDQEAEACSAEICRETDRRGSRHQAGVRGEKHTVFLNPKQPQRRITEYGYG